MGRNVVVIGGGAAGMMAAVQAAWTGAAVVLYEKNDRVGKKILSTGNGRCNFSNEIMGAQFYGAEQGFFRVTGNADTKSGGVFISSQ